MSTNNFTVALFLPIRNEIDALKVIMPLIESSWYDEILILDGSSTDGSVEYLESLGFKVHKQKSKGVRAAFWEGFELIASDVVIPFSPDGNSRVSDIPILINKIRGGDRIVIASRYLNGLKSQDDTYDSMLANKLFTKLVNFLFKSNLTDAIGMYKAFFKSDLYSLGIDKHKSEHSEILLIIRGLRSLFKISEIESPELPRIGVQGSRAHPGALGKYKSAFILLKSIIRDYIFYRPLK